MGYHVVRVFSDAVCLRPSRAWVEAGAVLEVTVARRAKWIQETTGLAKAQAKKLHEALKDAGAEDDVAAVLEGFRVKGTERARAGRLVVQPGAERRRTSSHYTPRSLSAPIVERTLEPLLKTMGEAPPARHDGAGLAVHFSRSCAALWGLAGGARFRADSELSLEAGGAECSL